MKIRKTENGYEIYSGWLNKKTWVQLWPLDVALEFAVRQVENITSISHEQLFFAIAKMRHGLLSTPRAEYLLSGIQSQPSLWSKFVSNRNFHLNDLQQTYLLMHKVCGKQVACLATAYLTSNILPIADDVKPESVLSWFQNHLLKGVNELNRNPTRRESFLLSAVCRYCEQMLEQPKELLTEEKIKKMDRLFVDLVEKQQKKKQQGK